MHAGFWLDRWQHQQIGFHTLTPNASLCSHWPARVTPGSQVLVPLCGKSVDMAWLLGQGYEVVGAELSGLAVEAFFNEQQVPYEVEVRGEHRLYRGPGVRIWQGDFLALGRADIGPCTAVYDRAALIALPPALREQYVAHVGRLLPAGTQGLLVSLEYPQEKLEGPPFCVMQEEVLRLYGPGWEVTPLDEIDALSRAAPRFHEAGVERLIETVYWLCKR